MPSSTSKVIAPSHYKITKMGNYCEICYQTSGITSLNRVSWCTSEPTDSELVCDVCYQKLASSRQCGACSRFITKWDPIEFPFHAVSFLGNFHKSRCFGCAQPRGVDHPYCYCGACMFAVNSRLEQSNLPDPLCGIIWEYCLIDDNISCTQGHKETQDVLNNIHPTNTPRNNNPAGNKSCDASRM